MEHWPLLAYYGVFLLLSVHGVHRALLCLRLLFCRKPDRRQMVPAGDGSPPTTPMVTVQLPLFNELYVARRLLDCVAALDWPKERLEIQVLDDSTDETAGIVSGRVAELVREGFLILHVRRPDRSGFKAGALDLGLRGGHGSPPASGSVIAIFDADFMPRPDFLRRTVPVLLADARVAVVQARWEHVNRGHSLLTRVQSVFLDAHFAVEHEARQRAGHFLNFNGTAAVWRRGAIEDAGGWSHDTLTEDLDLSFRAQIAGMRFAYLHDLTVPSELPIEMNAFKRQQHRWAKGAIETAHKLTGRLWRSPDLRLATKLEGTIHLFNNLAYVGLFLASLLALPAASQSFAANATLTAWIDRYLLGLGLLPVLLYLVVGQLRVGRGLFASLPLLPISIAVGAGLCVNNTLAVLEALAGRRSPFMRTPKYAAAQSADSWIDKRYGPAGDRLTSLLPWLEVGLSVACGLAAWVALRHGRLSFACLNGLFAAGYLWVGLASLLPVMTERLRHGLVTVLSMDRRGRQPRENSASA